MHLSHAGGVFITSYLKTDLPMCRWNYPKDHKNPTITYTLFSRFEKKFPSKNSLMEYIFWNKSLIHIYIYQSYKEYHILKDTHITHFLLGKSYN